MKKHILTWLLIAATCLAFADGKKELQTIADNINSKEFKNAKAQIDKLQEQGYAYYSKNEYSKALECYRKALVKAENLFGKNNSTAAASIYTAMALPYIKMNENLKAADLFFTASQIYKESAGGKLFPFIVYKLQLQAGSMYCILHKKQKSFKILKQIEQDVKKLSVSKKLVLYRYLADCYHSMKQYKKAVEYCQKAINEKNNNDLETQKRLAHVYDIWGNSLIGQNKRKQAVNKLQKSLRYASKTHMLNSFTGQLLQSIGVNYMNMDDYKNAKTYLLKAQEKFKYIKEKYFFWNGLTYLYLARNARYHKKWKESEKYYEKAAGFLEKSMDTLRLYDFSKNQLTKAEEETFMALCIVYKWLQTCFYWNKTQAQALAIYSKVKKIKNNNSIYLADIYPPLIANYIDLKKYKKARLLITEGIAISNSLSKKSQQEGNLATLCYLEARVLHLSGYENQGIKKCEEALVLFRKLYPKDSTKIKLIEKRLKEWKEKVHSQK